MRSFSGHGFARFARTLLAEGIAGARANVRKAPGEADAMAGATPPFAPAFSHWIDGMIFLLQPSLRQKRQHQQKDHPHHHATGPSLYANANRSTALP